MEVKASIQSESRSRYSEAGAWAKSPAPLPLSSSNYFRGTSVTTKSPHTSDSNCFLTCNWSLRLSAKSEIIRCANDKHALYPIGGCA